MNEIDVCKTLFNGLIVVLTFKRGNITWKSFLLLLIRLLLKDKVHTLNICLISVAD